MCVAGFFVAMPAANAAPTPISHGQSKVSPASEDWYLPDAGTRAYICANPAIWDGRTFPGHDKDGENAVYRVLWLEDSPSSTLLDMDMTANGQYAEFQMRC